MRWWPIAAGVAVMLLTGFRTLPPPAVPPAIGGARLATVLGCTDCHGADLAGKRLFDTPDGTTLWSANLTRVVARTDDAALERLLRTGVRADGSRLWYMDAIPYDALSAAEMRSLLAWLRTRPAAGAERPGIRMGPRFRKAVADGLVRPAADTLAEDRAKVPPIIVPLGHGRHLAVIACAGCHDPSLRGAADAPPGDPPDLATAAGYDAAAFRRLLRTGVGLDGREKGEMAAAAKVRLHALTDAEIGAIRSYLSAWVASRRDTG